MRLLNAAYIANSVSGYGTEEHDYECDDALSENRNTQDLVPDLIPKQIFWLLFESDDDEDDVKGPLKHFGFLNFLERGPIGNSVDVTWKHVNI